MRTSIVLLMVVPLSCGTSSPPGGTPVNLVRLYRGTWDDDAPARLVIRTSDAWASAWTRQNWGLSPPPLLPPVDFTADMVLVAALGRRNTGGYEASISVSTSKEADLRAEVVESEPGVGCVTTPVITRPSVAVRLVRSDGEVRFVDSVESVECR